MLSVAIKEKDKQLNLLIEKIV